MHGKLRFILLCVIIFELFEKKLTYPEEHVSYAQLTAHQLLYKWIWIYLTFSLYNTLWKRPLIIVVGATKSEVTPNIGRTIISGVISFIFSALCGCVPRRLTEYRIKLKSPIISFTRAMPMFIAFGLPDVIAIALVKLRNGDLA